MVVYRSFWIDRGRNMKIKIDRKTLESNIKALQSWMQKEKLEACYVSSFDPFLSEYTSMNNCRRFFITGFTGSVAEVLVPANGRPKLYVDGRYYEQADIEVDANLVEVVKNDSLGLFGNLLKDVQEAAYKNIAIEAPRTPQSYAEKLASLTTVKFYSKEDFDPLLPLTMDSQLSKLWLVDKEHRADSVQDKLARIFAKDDHSAYFITSADTVSWLSNCRSQQMPNQSYFLARMLVLKNKVVVYLGDKTPMPENYAEEVGLEFIQGQKAMQKSLEEELASYNVATLYIDQTLINAEDFLFLEKSKGSAKLEHKEDGLYSIQSLKTEREMKLIRESFNLADQAIFNTITWLRSEVEAGKEVSERDLYNKTNENYAAIGALNQSFNTICGVGPNGSIIHYGDPKDSVKIKKTDMCLVDSGGHFKAGYATDTTRTFMASATQGSEEYRKMYTLVLKGTLQVQNARFPIGTKGSYLDALARVALFNEGLNFAHSTGHGVGVNVHEPGVRISSVTQYILKPGHVVSIEPGFYQPGVGGVRLENIAHVIEDRDHPGFLKFEPLVYIAFDEYLIDRERLTGQEQIWLNEYQAECKKRGRWFNS